MELRKEIRIVVGQKAKSLSLSFKISQHKGDIYIVCRESTEMKLSLHRSGVFRLAENKSEPRAPILSTLYHEIGQPQVVVARIILSTETHWERIRLPVKGAIYLPPVNNDRIHVTTLGFLNFNPIENQNHPINAYLAGVMRLPDGRFFVTTTEAMTVSTFIKNMDETNGPSISTSLVGRIFPVVATSPFEPEMITRFQIYRSVLNSYHFWAHHNIPVGIAQNWGQTNLIYRAMVSTYERQSNGPIDPSHHFFSNPWQQLTDKILE